MNPILIDLEVQPPTGHEIVPWKPCVLVAMLQYWPVVIKGLQRRTSFGAHEFPETHLAFLFSTEEAHSSPGPSSIVAAVTHSEEYPNITTENHSNTPGPSCTTVVATKTSTM
jgi:hypothetical protein